MNGHLSALGFDLTTTPLERLKHGIRTFQRERYPARADLYKTMSVTQQRPHTLMITCADSRIDIEDLTQSLPGELFIMRNVGNLVPDYGDMIGGVSAVIEYAVVALKVAHIVVCGHSDCGAMKGLSDPHKLEALPVVSSWLRHAHAAPAGVQTAQTLATLTEDNVLLQLDHLRTHPSVAGALASGVLTTSGWVYDIGSGAVRIAEHDERAFREVGSM